MNIVSIRPAAGRHTEYQIVEHSDEDDFVELRQTDDHGNRIRIEKRMLVMVGDELIEYARLYEDTR